MVKERLENLSKVYFNAGRFAAGATDATAVKAHADMQKYEAL
ncbi:MAG TPA: hypothetical protein VK149_04185 [Sideroxyarcus sp.]|nr:hypothetical protein [Sideroxyarcus sp.]